MIQDPITQKTLFRDRHEAGKQLAEALRHYKDAKDTLIVALPRGGVTVGYEISVALHLPLDVLITRKLGTPGNPELAMGALTETGYRHLNTDVIRECEVSSGQLEEEVRIQQEEIKRRIARYRHGLPLPPLKDRTVILVDDGIATGATFFASLAAMRAAQVHRLVAAVPVAPPRVVPDLRQMVNEVVILATRTRFFAIGQFYLDFDQVQDEEVVNALQKAQETYKSCQA
jgi:putative phosphoribosyl transferase